MFFNSESVLYRACDIAPYLSSICKRRVPDEISAETPYEDVNASNTTPVFVQYGTNDTSLCYATIVRDAPAFQDAKRFSRYEIYILDSKKAESIFRPKIKKLANKRVRPEGLTSTQLEIAFA